MDASNMRVSWRQDCIFNGLMQGHTQNIETLWYSLGTDECHTMQNISLLDPYRLEISK